MAGELEFVRSLVPEIGVEDTKDIRRKIRSKLRSSPFDYASSMGVGFTLNGIAFLYQSEEGTLKITPTEEDIQAVVRSGSKRAGPRKPRKGKRAPDFSMQKDVGTAHLTDEEYLSRLFEAIPKDCPIQPAPFKAGLRYYAFPTITLRSDPPERAAQKIIDRTEELGFMKEGLHLVIMQNNINQLSFNVVGVGPV